MLTHDSLKIDLGVESDLLSKKSIQIKADVMVYLKMLIHCSLVAFLS